MTLDEVIGHVSDTHQKHMWQKKKDIIKTFCASKDIVKKMKRQTI